MAGLILDNYLSEEAEYYVAGAFPVDVVARVGQRFEEAIERVALSEHPKIYMTSA